MANEVVATFAGPLDRNLNGAVFANSFTIANANAAAVTLDRFGISGRTAKFPVRWATFTGFTSNPVGSIAFNNANTAGLGSEAVVLTFANFEATEEAIFDSIDADFTNVPQPPDSVVRVLDLEGARAVAVFSDGTSVSGVFQVAVVAGSPVLRAVLAL